MKKKVAQVRAPAGFKWRIIKYSPTNVHVNLVHKVNNKKIGGIRLYNEDGFWETHSHLNEKYRNLGFGTKLYARAIQYCLANGYRVRSSGTSSQDAQRVWRGKTIRKFFRIRTKHYKPNSTYKVNPDYDTFYAYRK